MATTYTLISSQTLGSNTSSVTFSSIPQTYTDLILKMSLNGNTDANCKLQINGNSSAVYSFTGLRGDGSSVISSRNSAQTIFLLTQSLRMATANVFASHEYYFPNYTNSTIKPISIDYTTEAASTTSYIWARAHLFNNTSAITSLTFSNDTDVLVTGSSFYLYGIKNS